MPQNANWSIDIAGAPWYVGPVRIYRGQTRSGWNTTDGGRWWTTDLVYMQQRVVAYHDVQYLVTAEIDDSLLSTARRHMGCQRAHFPAGMRKLSAYHAGDQAICAKMEHGSLNLGFYGNTRAAIRVTSIMAL